MELGTQNVHVHNTEHMGFNFKLTEKISSPYLIQSMETEIKPNKNDKS